MISDRVWQRKKNQEKNLPQKVFLCPYHQSCGAGGRDDGLSFFQFLVSNVVLCIWWLMKIMRTKGRMIIHLLPYLLLLAFLLFDMVWTILNRSLTSEFYGSEFVLMNVLNSFVESKIKCFSFGMLHNWIWLYSFSSKWKEESKYVVHSWKEKHKSKVNPEASLVNFNMACSDRY